MTKCEFKTIYVKLRAAYPFFDDGKTDNKMRMWWGFFENANYSEVMFVINQWIRVNNTEPAVADIMNGLGNIKEREHKERVRKTKSAFECPKCKNKGVIFYEMPNGSEWAESCDCMIANAMGVHYSVPKEPKDDWDKENIFLIDKACDDYRIVEETIECQHAALKRLRVVMA